MTTQRRTAVAVSVLAVVTLALSVSGCGVSFETNEAACERMMNHLGDCTLGMGVPDGSGLYDVYVSQVCNTVPETSEGDWSALADCVTSFSCAQLTGEDPITDSEVFGSCFAVVAVR